MKLVRKTLTVKTGDKELLELWQALNPEYNSLLKKTRDLYLKHLNLEKSDSIPQIEIFSPPEKTLLFYRQTDNDLELGGLILEPSHEELFAKFGKKIRKKLSTLLTQEIPPLKEFNPTSETFEEIKDNITPLKLLEGEIQAAKLLVDNNLRDFLRETEKTKRKLIAEETPERKMAKVLGDSDLLEREYQIFCRESGQQLMRVESDAYTDMVKNQFRCTTCGRPFNKEKVDLWVSLAPLGEKLAQKNYWMALLIMDKAPELELAPEKILVKKEADSFILFLQQDHHLVMIKVNEKKPAPQDIFLFSKLQKFFNPDHSVYFSLLPISPTAKRYLNASTLSSLTIIEGEDQLDKLSGLLEQKREDYVLETFAELSTVTKTPVAEFIYSFLTAKEAEEKIESVEAKEAKAEPKEEVEKAESPKETAEIVEEEKVEPPQLEAEIPKAKEEEALEDLLAKAAKAVTEEREEEPAQANEAVVEEKEEKEEPAKEEKEEIAEIEEPAKAKEAVVEEKEEAAEIEEPAKAKEAVVEEKEEKEEPAKEEKEEIAAPEELVKEEEEIAAQEKEEEKDAEIKEEKPKEEPKSVEQAEEIKPPAAEKEPTAAKEELPTPEIDSHIATEDEAVAVFKKELAETKVAGNWKKLKLSLADKFPLTPAILADDFGLTLVKSKPLLKAADSFAPLGKESFQLMGQTFKLEKLPGPDSIYLDGENGILHSHKISDLYLLIWQGGVPVAEEEKPSGEKIGIKDLASSSGVEKVLLLSLEGEIKDTHPKRMQKFSAQENLLTRIWEQGNKLLKRTDFSPLKKIMLKTTDVHLLIVSLDEANLLALFLKSDLDPGKISTLEERVKSFSLS